MYPGSKEKVTQYPDLLRRIIRRWPLVILALLLLYLAPFYVLHIHSIASEWVFNDDERQWVWPMLHYADPTLFEGDYLFSYAMAETPVGYKVIYWLASTVIDPRWFTKMLAYALLLVTVLFTSLSADRLGGPEAGWASAAILLISGFWLSVVAGGLPRSFSPAFAAVAMYSLVTNRPWLLAFMTPLAASFYPPIAVVMGLALLVFFLVPSYKGGPSEGWSIQRRLFVLAISGFATLTILNVGNAERARFGSLIDVTDQSDISAYPERLARNSLNMPDRRVNWPSVISMPLSMTAEAVEGKWRLVPATSFSGKLIILALAGCIVFLVLNSNDKAAIRLLLLPAAAIFASLLAAAVYPKLYYPSRYLISVPLIFVAALPVALALSVTNPANHNRSQRIAVGTIVFLLIFGWRGPEPAVGYWEQRGAAVQPIFFHIKTLPKSALLAGWEPIDDVPLLSRRSILFSQEMHNVHRTDFALELRRRVNAFIDAYYSDRLEPLVRLHEEFGVTHILADRRHFNPKSKAPYFAPFNRRIKVLKETASQKSVIRRLIDSSHAEHLTPYVSIIDLTKWRQTLGAGGTE